ncbi:hypothetical protein CPB83DRAFT_831264 [Crepidotus variabilis]|uniref:Uncharacterized protein n=1 Tax=Crepidotus variabilis TaxID=179855 RepID=A0A9P6JVA4_9AGAR|nr:hypothetical protein CPB83DRAFT_831264 [Crepidotus variabilis]
MIASVLHSLQAVPLSQSIGLTPDSKIIVNASNAQIIYAPDQEQQQDCDITYKVASSAIVMAKKKSYGGKFCAVDINECTDEVPATKFWVLAPKGQCYDYFPVKVLVENKEIQSIENNLCSIDSKTKPVGAYEYTGTQNLFNISLVPWPPKKWNKIAVYQIQFEEDPQFTSAPSTASSYTDISSRSAPLRTFTSTSSASHAEIRSSKLPAMTIGLSISLPTAFILFIAWFFLCRKSRRKIEFNPSEMGGRPIDASPFPSEKQDRYLFIPRSFLSPFTKSKSQILIPHGPQSPRNSTVDIFGSEITVMQKREETQPFETMSKAPSHHSTLSYVTDPPEVDEAYPEKIGAAH